MNYQKEKSRTHFFYNHINFINKAHYERMFPYEKTEANQIVVEFIASMTDDYFVDLFEHLFPECEHGIKYIGYFK